MLKDSADKAQEIADNIKKVKEDIADYDLSRTIKKVEAELLDLQYNLSIAIRLMEKS
jgi:hypothetical protein